MENSYYKSLEPYWGTWFLKKQLGEGAFGKVFEAERHDLGRTYKSAIKVITIPQTSGEWNSVLAEGMDERSVTTFYRGFVDEIINEVELMSRLKGNTNIVSYEDHMVLEHADGRGWDIIIRMELLTPLVKALAKNDHLDREVVLKLGCDICRALEYCEEEHIIHRDIKPENIFLTHKGDFKLGDFGIARTVEKSMGGLSKKGTYSYMAPEVFKNQPYGITVDIYSLGLVLYKLLNRNRAPFMPPYPESIAHSDREQAIAKRIGGEVMPLPVEAQDELGRVVVKACSYQPQDRYQSAADMRRALEQCRNGEITSAKIAADMKEFVEDEKTEILFSTRRDDEKIQYASNEKSVSEENERAGGNSLYPPEVKKQETIPAEKPTKYILYVALAILFLVAGYLLAAFVLKGTNKKEEEPVSLNTYVKIDDGFSEEPTTTEEENKSTGTASVKIGDTISFGTYEQDADDKNGKEEIFWTVLDEKDDRILLISNKILDYSQYNDTEDKVTWENCSTRKWLNDVFYKEAFNDEEKERILEMELDNPSSYDFYQSSYMSERWSWWKDGDLKGSTGGADTNDKVFLLSYEEALKYFEDGERRAEATASTVEKGIYSMRADDYKKDYSEIYAEESIGKAVWWLRSPAWDADHIMRVDYDGRINAARISGDWFGIRPAIWIKKE